jgi:hypothetical protein
MLFDTAPQWARDTEIVDILGFFVYPYFSRCTSLDVCFWSN